MAHRSLCTSWWLLFAQTWFCLCLLSGCGTTNQRTATEQLTLSDAVDQSVAQINFDSLGGKKVYFDTQYLKNVKGMGFVNGDYIISSLRQQMTASGCLLTEVQDDADYIIEGRVGTLGADGFNFLFGIPANKVLSDISSLVPNSPQIPSFPEIALARREDLRGAAKIAVFAYHRETRQPVWQSGIAVAEKHFQRYLGSRCRTISKREYQ